MIFSLQIWNSANLSFPGVKTGGGGYVTGIVIHPSAANRMYIRTDVGGAYRWEPSNQEWKPILDGVSGGNQVDGIALDAQKPDRVYVALNSGGRRQTLRNAFKWS